MKTLQNVQILKNWNTYGWKAWKVATKTDHKLYWFPYKNEYFSNASSKSPSVVATWACLCEDGTCIDLKEHLASTAWRFSLRFIWWKNIIFSIKVQRLFDIRNEIINCPWIQNLSKLYHTMNSSISMVKLYLTRYDISNPAHSHFNSLPCRSLLMKRVETVSHQHSSFFLTVEVYL